MGTSVHLIGEITNGENFGLSTGLLFSHTFQTQRLHELSMCHKGAAFKSPEGKVLSLFPSKSENFNGLWREVLFLFCLHLFTILCVVKTSHFKMMQLQLLFQN